jgi:hypothetical protein
VTQNELRRKFLREAAAELVRAGDELRRKRAISKEDHRDHLSSAGRMYHYAERNGND